MKELKVPNVQTADSGNVNQRRPIDPPSRSIDNTRLHATGEQTGQISKQGKTAQDPPGTGPFEAGNAMVPQPKRRLSGKGSRQNLTPGPSAQDERSAAKEKLAKLQRAMVEKNALRSEVTAKFRRLEGLAADARNKQIANFCKDLSDNTEIPENIKKPLISDAQNCEALKNNATYQQLQNSTNNLEKRSAELVRVSSENMDEKQTEELVDSTKKHIETLKSGTTEFLFSVIDQYRLYDERIKEANRRLNKVLVANKATNSDVSQLQRDIREAERLIVDLESESATEFAAPEPAEPGASAVHIPDHSRGSDSSREFLIRKMDSMNNDLATLSEISPGGEDKRKEELIGEIKKIEAELDNLDKPANEDAKETDTPKPAAREGSPVNLQDEQKKLEDDRKTLLLTIDLLNADLERLSADYPNGADRQKAEIIAALKLKVAELDQLDERQALLNEALSRQEIKDILRKNLADPNAHPQTQQNTQDRIDNAEQLAEALRLQKIFDQTFLERLNS